MKYLGIDYGTKRIGISLSNQEGTIAFPKETIPKSKDLAQDILDIIEHEGVSTVVIGKSLDPWGSENSLQRDINSFIKLLSYDLDSVEIIEQDERGSSLAASSHLYGKGNIANEKWTGKDNAKKREHNDANAATVILQRYLDKQKLAS